jgi:hypothetical protein
MKSMQSLALFTEPECASLRLRDLRQDVGIVWPNLQKPETLKLPQMLPYSLVVETARSGRVINDLFGAVPVAISAISKKK